jgi:hypothetical protein
MTWKHTFFILAKTFNNSISWGRGKGFWDAKGILLLEFLPRDETVNISHYCTTLNKQTEGRFSSRETRKDAKWCDFAS